MRSTVEVSIGLSPGAGVGEGAGFGGVCAKAASATAEDSTYAGIVRLAQAAGAESAPVVRLADRYAAWFLPLALAVAAVFVVQMGYFAVLEWAMQGQTVGKRILGLRVLRQSNVKGGA